MGSALPLARAAFLFLCLVPAGVAAQNPDTAIPAAVCDLLAAHPFDPDRIGPGVVSWDMDHERALPACEAAVAAEPDNVRLAFQFGRTLERAQRYDEARAQFQRAADRGHVPAMSSLALMLLYRENPSLTDLPVALALLRRAVDAGFVSAIMAYGDILREGRGVARDDAAAVAQYRRAAEMGNPLAQMRLAAALIAGRGVTADEAEAERLLRLAVAQNWVGAFADYAAFLLERNRDLPAAERLARRALAANPESGLYSHILASVLLRAGRSAEALVYARYAAERAPDEAVAHERLGDALQATGDNAAAAEAWRRALELAGDAAMRSRLEQRLRAAPAAPPAPGK